MFLFFVWSAITFLFLKSLLLLILCTTLLGVFVSNQRKTSFFNTTVALILIDFAIQAKYAEAFVLLCVYLTIEVFEEFSEKKYLVQADIIKKRNALQVGLIVSIFIISMPLYFSIDWKELNTLEFDGGLIFILSFVLYGSLQRRFG